MLVPIDLRPGSDRVLGRLALLPLADAARVRLLHVVPGRLPSREQRIARRDAATALAGEARHLRKALPVSARITTLVKLGAAAREIVACATRVKADLVVMGRNDARTLRDAFLGSTAERVIRQARHPVLVARLPPRAAYRRPALALDLDQAAHEVVRLMLQVFPPPRPRAAVIHAIDVPYQRLFYPSLPADDADATKDELNTKAAQELAKLLAAALARAKVPPQDAPWRMQIRYGSPRSVVEKALKKTEPDLLVLGTRGYSGAPHAFLGTVVGDVLREATCDVLVVPPADRRR